MAKKSAKKVTKKSPGKKRGGPAKTKPAPMTRVRRSSAEIDEACEKVKQALHTAQGLGEKMSVEKACNMYGLTPQAYYRCKDRKVNEKLAAGDYDVPPKELRGNYKVDTTTIRDTLDNLTHNLVKLSEAYDELGTTQMYNTDEVIRFLRVFKDKLIEAAN